MSDLALDIMEASALALRDPSNPKKGVKIKVTDIILLQNWI